MVKERSARASVVITARTRNKPIKRLKTAVGKWRENSFRIILASPL
jgi:hypothetical protein